MILFMNPYTKKVFISYVKEDSAQVDELCKVLKAAGVPYWRDRESLGPGDAWRDKIREAIRQGSMVFLACFSDNSNTKRKSYMNEELNLAVEEYRQVAPGQTWIIPVRFSDVQLPPWELSAGRTLSDINYVNFFGDSKPTAAAELTRKLGELLGVSTPDPRQIQAAVEDENAEERAIHLTRLAKEMLLDPKKQIELDDLVSNEVKRLINILNDTKPDEQYSQLEGDSKRLIFAAERAEYLAQVSAPFCATLKVAACWGKPEQLEPWVSGIRQLVVSADKIRPGHEFLHKLLHIPGIMAIITSTTSAACKKNWINLKTLVVDQSVPVQYKESPEPILELTNIYKIMDRSLANVISRSRHAGISIEEAINARKSYYTPEADWVNHIIRPWFNDLIPTQEEYDSLFDQAEVILGMLSTDYILATQTSEGSNAVFPIRTCWFGRSMWRTRNHQFNPIKIFAHELNTQGIQWGPLKAGLFGGSEQRATSALNEYKNLFDELSSKMW
jgi:hypothetical protein